MKVEFKREDYLSLVQWFKKPYNTEYVLDLKPVCDHGKFCSETRCPEHHHCYSLCDYNPTANFCVTAKKLARVVSDSLNLLYPMSSRIMRNLEEADRKEWIDALDKLSTALKNCR